jgi:drug/metabolite transporter (DMT)-like permease
MEPRQRPLLALGIRLVGAMSLATMLMMVKVVGERGVALSETIFWRQLFPALFIFAWLAARRQIGTLATRRFPVHVRRTVIGLVGMYLNLGVVLLLPLAEATTLAFTAPVFAVILAALLLKEKVGPVRWLAVLLGLAGVAIIAGPDREAIPLAGLAVGLGAPFMVALISIQVRDLGRTELPLTIVFWFSALCVPLAAIPAWLNATPHDATTWLLILGIGVTGALGQIMLTASLRLGNVSSVIVMDYSQFGWAMLWGFLIFDHLPPTATWIGAPVIIAAGLIIVWREHRLHLEKAAGGPGS